MELRVLRYFLTVTQERNITRAAQKLLISQPTLSKQLSDLEHELGTTLFIRGHKQITLTSEGEYLRSKAAEIITLADKTAINIQSDQIISGDLTIGAGESIGMSNIMKIVSDIMQDYQGVKIHLVSGNAEEMESMLNHGSIDFAVLMGKKNLDDYHYLQTNAINHWGIIMRRDDSMVKNKFITPNDLVNLPLLMSSQALKSNRFQEWWKNLGPKMNIVGTFSLVFNAQLLVKNSNIYMVSFDGLIDNSQNSDLAFRPLEPQLTESTTVIWKKNIVQSKVAQLFIKRLTASLEQDN